MRWNIIQRLVERPVEAFLEIALDFRVGFLPAAPPILGADVGYLFGRQIFRPLTKLALLRLFVIGRRACQLRQRLAVLCDDDVLALRGIFDELRKVGFGVVEIDLPDHAAILTKLVKLVKSVRGRLAHRARHGTFGLHAGEARVHGLEPGR